MKGKGKEKKKKKGKKKHEVYEEASGDELEGSTLNKNNKDLLDKKEDEDEEESTKKREPGYDPTLSSQIISIRFENNQNIFINYDKTTTIEDVIKIIIDSNEFKLLAYNRNNIIFSKNTTVLYDLILNCFEDIKNSYENKMSLKTLVNELHEQKFLKSHRTPLFSFITNIAPRSYIESKQNFEEESKIIKNNNNNYWSKYYNYLPRQMKFVPNLSIVHPELIEYFKENTKYYKEFNPYIREELTTDNDIDWFIYGKEKLKNKKNPIFAI